MVNTDYWHSLQVALEIIPTRRNLALIQADTEPHYSALNGQRKRRRIHHWDPRIAQCPRLTLLPCQEAALKLFRPGRILLFISASRWLRERGYFENFARPYKSIHSALRIYNVRHTCARTHTHVYTRRVYYARTELYQLDELIADRVYWCTYDSLRSIKRNNPRRGVRQKLPAVIERLRRPARNLFSTGQSNPFLSTRIHGISRSRRRVERVVDPTPNRLIGSACLQLCGIANYRNIVGFRAFADSITRSPTGSH